MMKFVRQVLDGLDSNMTRPEKKASKCSDVLSTNLICVTQAVYKTYWSEVSQYQLCHWILQARPGPRNRVAAAAAQDPLSHQHHRWPSHCQPSRLRHHHQGWWDMGKLLTQWCFLVRIGLGNVNMAPSCTINEETSYTHAQKRWGPTCGWSRCEILRDYRISTTVGSRLSTLSLVSQAAILCLGPTS